MSAKFHSKSLGNQNCNSEGNEDHTVRVRECSEGDEDHRLRVRVMGITV